MGGEPRPIGGRIVAFDQDRFVGLHLRYVEPAVGGVVSDAVDLAGSIAIDQIGGDKVREGYGRRVADGEWRIAERPADRAPHIDDFAPRRVCSAPPMWVTISPPTAAARFRTPKSIDAGDAAADRFPRCGPGRPYCRRQSVPPDGARGHRLPESNRSPHRSAHWRRGYPAASAPSPCSVRARIWHDMPWQRRRSMGSP